MIFGIKDMSEHLYTPADVKRYRDELVKKQNGIDPILLEPFKETPVLDHSHSTQRVRAALNRNSNAFEGKVYNAWVRCLKWLSDKPLPEILRNLADYYEETERIEHTMPYHPGFIKRLCTDFANLNEAGKKQVLLQMSQHQGNNGTERKSIFRKAILSKKYTFEQIQKLIQTEKEKA